MVGKGFKFFFDIKKERINAFLCAAFLPLQKYVLISLNCIFVDIYHTSLLLNWAQQVMLDFSDVIKICPQSLFQITPLHNKREKASVCLLAAYMQICCRIYQEAIHKIVGLMYVSIMLIFIGYLYVNAPHTDVSYLYYEFRQKMSWIFW